MNRTGTVILLTICCTAHGASAQATPEAATLRQDCRVYRQALLTGEPATRRAEALERVNLCADAAKIFVDWLGSLRTETSPAQFTDFRSEVSGVRDGRLFVRALTMAQDRGASPTARVIALLVVLDQQGYSWSATFTDVTTRGRYCGLPPVADPDTRVLTPLPADYMAQSLAITGRLAADSTEPSVVRNAAACVDRYLQLRNTVYRDEPPALHP